MQRRKNGREAPQGDQKDAKKEQKYGGQEGAKEDPELFKKLLSGVGSP